MRGCAAAVYKRGTVNTRLGFAMSPPTMYPGVLVLDDHARSLEDQKRAYAEPQHQGCHCDRARQRCRRRKLLFLIPAVISLLAIAAFLAFACFTESGSSMLRDAGLDGILLPRQDSGSPGTSRGFVDRKRMSTMVSLRWRNDRKRSRRLLDVIAQST